MPDLYVSVALDDSGDVIRNFNLSANSKEPSLINVGLRDICTMDSLETVLSKLGFTNAAELADLVTYTYSLPDEERRQFFKSGGNVNGLQYDNGNFSMHIFPEMDSTEEFFVDIVVRGLPGLWNYNMFFIFSNAMSLDTYRLSVVSWSPSY